MTSRPHYTAALGTAATVAALLAGLYTQVAAARTAMALPSSDYAVRAVCPPPAPGRATCLALQLVARVPQANADARPPGPKSAATPTVAPSPALGEVGRTPQELHTAYNLPTSAPSSQTVALVDAYNDLHAEEDLKTYDKEFHLPECTTANGCFVKVGERGGEGEGSLPFPQNPASLKAEESSCEKGDKAACERAGAAAGWTVETSLDIETAHAICQSCKVALVEAESPEYVDLGVAEDTAVGLGATEVSNSWGGPECFEGECIEDSPALNHPGTVITAAAGDDGYLDWDAEYSFEQGYADYPASSPHVVAVGGTRLILDSGHAWEQETVWNGDGAGGGGCSEAFAAQPWQKRVPDWSSVGCREMRAVADVSADADPYTGVAVRDSSPECVAPYEERHKYLLNWCTIGGTSLASPIIAAVYALAGGAGGVAYPSRTLYENEARNPGSLHDVVEGSNGRCGEGESFNNEGESECTVSEEAASCSPYLICLAAPGYDGPTGVGTPNGISAFEPTGVGNEEGTTSSGPPASAQPPSTAAPLVTAAPLLTAAHAQLSGLALTLNALIALNRSRPSIAKLAFTFKLNVAAHVRVSLEERVGKGGHKHWKAVLRPFTIAALSGHNSKRLTGHGVLSSGAYRLTLAPTGGVPRSISFKIG
jgi:Subtilase family